MTTTQSLAEPSTRPLSEVARHIVIPSGIVDTLWFDVEERCREFGDEFDAWQDGLGQVVLGIRADGMFAATVGGVTLSIPRQVAKTFLIMRIVVALCTLYPNLTVVWTAHRLRTATLTFQRMKSLVMKPAVKGYLRLGGNQGTAIRDANGEQQIPFLNGSVIMFGARDQGFGRGFDQIDIEVFDEAQILTERALDDMIPATNQSKFEHGALLFYMGTPPRPIDPGEVFTSRRREALALIGDAEPFGEPTVGEDAVYIECSADPGADPDDRVQWAKANPSYPHRTPEVSMRRLRKNLVVVESWLREGLGIWDEDADAERAVSMADWSAASDPDVDLDSLTEVRICLDAPPGARSATFSMAARRPDGKVHVQVRREVPAKERGNPLSVKARVLRFAEVLTAGHNTPIIIPPGPARSWLGDLQAAGVPVDEMTHQDYAAGCALIQSEVAQGNLTHRDQPEMNRAVEGLENRPSGDVDVWSRRKSSANIAPFVAATCALYRVPEQQGPSWLFV